MTTETVSKIYVAKTGIRTKMLKHRCVKKMLQMMHKMTKNIHNLLNNRRKCQHEELLFLAVFQGCLWKFQEIIKQQGLSKLLQTKEVKLSQVVA